MEMVADLSANEFLLGLHQFIARCGKTDIIILDNAPKFKLMKSTIDTNWEKATKDPEVQSHVAEQGIKWSYIIELSPWMGGFYERLVGTTKRTLRKSFGKNCLTMIHLQTFLAETEAILNLRPLTYAREDFNGGIDLTPSHFPFPSTETGAPSPKDNKEINDPDFKGGKITSREELLNIWERVEHARNALEIMEKRLSIELT